MGNLAARFAVAAVAVPGLLALLIVGPAWGWWLLAWIVSGIGLDEFGRITLGALPARLLLILLGLLFGAGVFVLAETRVRADVLGGLDAGLFGLLLVLVVFVIPMLAHLFFTVASREAVDRAVFTTLGALYVGGLFGVLALIRNLGGFEEGWRWVLVILGVNWLNDTGGYFAGRFLGRHKLFPRVSPKKTWEGSLGGVLAGVGWLFVSRALYLDTLSVADCVVLGILGGAVGQVGDLIESVIKRGFQVKDSGGILPGHGGILDRMDAVLLASPLVYFYALWVHPL